MKKINFKFKNQTTVIISGLTLCVQISLAQNTPVSAISGVTNNFVPLFNNTSGNPVLVKNSDLFNDPTYNANFGFFGMGTNNSAPFSGEYFGIKKDATTGVFQRIYNVNTGGGSGYSGLAISCGPTSPSTLGLWSLGPSYPPSNGENNANRNVIGSNAPNGLHIGPTNTAEFGFYTSNLRRMTITSGGFVGLGLNFATPTSLLHLNDNTNPANSVYAQMTNYATGSGASNGLQVGVSFGGDAEIRHRGNFNLNFFTTNVQRMTILGGTGSNAGFVGIGLTSPTQMLHMNNGAILLHGSVPGVGGPQILLGGTTASAPYGEFGIEYDAGDHGLNFWKPSGSHSVSGGASSWTNYGLFINDDGNIGMGVLPTTLNTPGYQYKLSVLGAVRATKVVVEIGWADFVFNKEYKLASLSEVEKYIKQNKHLPNIPSASEIEEKGLDVGAIQAKQMEKIEELTLYIIELNKKLEAQEAKIKALESK